MNFLFIVVSLVLSSVVYADSNSTAFATGFSNALADNISRRNGGTSNSEYEPPEGTQIVWEAVTDRGQFSRRSFETLGACSRYIILNPTFTDCVYTVE